MRTNKIQRFSVMLLMSLIGCALWAQIPSGYYDNANNKTGDELKVALHNIIKGHTSVGYAGLWAAYKTTDLDANGKIWDIYSNYQYTYSTNQCGTYQKEGNCYNREHTWPQSWFNESSTPKADLFHVYPTDGFVNGKRSNYPYGEVSNPTYTSGNGSKLGPCTTSGYSGTVFEPIDEYKGDIARGFFYMSVRYYSEDSGWSTSDMTNKSEILSWAMTMLLRWADDDPVSQKEIDRNNAVYGIQGNRNPFIDHPEYARMIWDPNYTAATSYSITCTSNLSGGSISAPATAAEGTTVALTATPDAGYELDTWTVYKTGSPSTTVSVTSNGTFTMPGYAVTVSATFKQNTTLYDIALGTPTNGSISITGNTTSALSGTTINLTATPASGYTLYKWYAYKTGDMNTEVTVANNQFTMPSFPVTVTASFVEPGSYTYNKVTSAPSDWSGEYLIVYEGGNVAFNGGLTTLDATSNTISVSISNNSIASTTATDAANFTIAKSGTIYTIKSASGYYIGQTSDANGLASNNSTTYTNTLAYNSDNIDIVGSGGAYLRYNSANDQKRFRYFKSSSYTNQQAIQLYKKTGSAQTPTHTVTFHNGNSTTTQTVNEFESTALTANTFTKTDFVFAGWNTKEDGTGDFYEDGANVKLLADLDLYAQWYSMWTITIASNIENGTVTASTNKAEEGALVTLTATPNENCVFYYWDVMDDHDNQITVADNQFEMPDGPVIVNAVFVYTGTPTSTTTYYQLVTSTDQLVAGKEYLIVNTSAGKALSTTQNNNNRGATTVTISNNNTIGTIGNDVCELTLGGSTGAWTFYTGSGYLYAASSSDNYLRTQSTNNANGEWSISVNNTGVSSITAQGTNTRNKLKYNSNNTIFSCYASGQQDVALFVKVEQAAVNTIILADNDDKVTEKNSSVINDNAGQSGNVILYGRTLYKDGAWNTLCLPFDVNVSGSVLDGATLKELDNSSTLYNGHKTGLEGSTLYLNFKDATTIEAGKPYIIKWDSNNTNIVSPTFTGVTMGNSATPDSVSSTDQSVTFKGTYGPVPLPKDDKTNLFVDAGNTLSWPSTDNYSIKAFRAYFKLSEEVQAREFVLNFGDDEVTTGIFENEELRMRNEELEDGIYDLQGRKMVNGQLKRGLYIVNGKKVVIK